jgi:hypothetical protein
VDSSPAQDSTARSAHPAAGAGISKEHGSATVVISWCRERLSRRPSRHQHRLPRGTHASIGREAGRATAGYTRTLDERITALVGLADYRPDVAPQNTPELADGINKAIESGEVLWKLHGTVVLGPLGQPWWVKIGTSLDPDEVANLLYIKAKTPTVPAPACLGCLTTKQRICLHVTVRRRHARVAVAKSLCRVQGVGKTTARWHIPCIA